MDFSYSYKDTMYKMAGGCPVFTRGSSPVESQYTSLFFEYPLGFNIEIPIFGLTTALAALRRNYTDMVIRLTIDTFEKECSGAETLLKYFSTRGYDSRLLKAKNPKGEVYYGNKGIVLDSNFVPLLLVTRPIITDDSGEAVFGKATVHLHPEVFINDTGFVNKSLAKKATAFYLSQDIYNSGSFERVKVVIDDCSNYIKKPAPPNPNTTSTESMYEVLKENIDDVLGQTIYD